MAKNCGNSFFGTKGFYVVNKGFYTYKDGTMDQREAIPVKDPAPKLGDKWDYFFRAVRSRKQEDMSVTTLDAYHSCASLSPCQYGFPTWTVTELRS